MINGYHFLLFINANHVLTKCFLKMNLFKEQEKENSVWKNSSV